MANQFGTATSNDLFESSSIPDQDEHEDCFIDEEENSIDDFLRKSKHEMQNNLEIEVSLFMSSTGIKFAMSNFYFRQLLSNFRPDFNLPSIENKMIVCLDNALREIVSKMKRILDPIEKITLMVNLVNLEVLEKDVVCISVCFECDQKLEILLLAVRQFEIKQENWFDLKPLIEKILTKYKLTNKKVVKTLVSGFEQIGVSNERIQVVNPFHCIYHKLLPSFLNDVLIEDGNFKLFMDEIMSVLQYFVRNAKATQLFKQQCNNITFDLNEMTFDELIKILSKYKSEFLLICSQILANSRILSNEQWIYLEQICQLRKLICTHLDAIKNQKGILTVDRIIPFLNCALNLLEKNFNALGKIPLNLKAKIMEYLNEIFNSKDEKIERIWLKASCLNPQIVVSNNLITKNQISIGKEWLQNSANIGMSKEELFSYLEIYFKQIKSDPEIYQHINPFDFWRHNARTYGKLSEYAMELLSIPVEATLPFGSSTTQNEDLDEDDFELSVNNNMTYIKMTQNIDDIERNSIIRFNQALCDGTHQQGSSEDFIEDDDESIENDESMEEESTPFDESHIIRQVMRAYREESVHPEFINQAIRRETENNDAQQESNRKHSNENMYDRRKPGNSRSRSRSPINKVPRSASKYFKDIASGGDASFDTPVILVYGVNQQDFDCKRIYNLFCGYGDVIRLTFMQTRKFACMVEMRNISQANNVRKYLNKMKVFKRELIICPTDIHHVWVNNRLTDLKLDNGKGYFMDCSRQNNPILNSNAIEDMAYPSKRTYFENVPAGFTVDQIKKLLTKFRSSAPQPNQIKLITENSSDSVSGYMVFNTKPEAAEAIMIYNLMRIDESHRLHIRFTQSAIF